MLNSCADSAFAYNQLISEVSKDFYKVNMINAIGIVNIMNI